MAIKGHIEGKEHRRGGQGWGRRQDSTATKWKEVTCGMTAWEQILMWSLTGVAMGLTITLGVCMLRLWLKVKMMRGGGEGVAKAMKKAIRDLKSRLIDI